jgi:KDO2-lipid IV(A) lauroyltransferase
MAETYSPHHSIMETGKSLTEAPHLWRVPGNRIKAPVKMTTGQALMDGAIAEDWGVILAAPQHGRWVRCGLYIAMRNPVTSLYRPPGLKDLKDVIRTGCEHTGPAWR